jgi:hypothetical protein
VGVGEGDDAFQVEGVEAEQVDQQVGVQAGGLLVEEPGQLGAGRRGGGAQE